MQYPASKYLHFGSKFIQEASETRQSGTTDTTRSPHRQREHRPGQPRAPATGGPVATETAGEHAGMGTRQAGAASHRGTATPTPTSKRHEDRQTTPQGNSAGRAQYWRPHPTRSRPARQRRRPGHQRSRRAATAGKQQRQPGPASERIRQNGKHDPQRKHRPGEQQHQPGQARPDTRQRANAGTEQRPATPDQEPAETEPGSCRMWAMASS